MPHIKVEFAKLQALGYTYADISQRIRQAKGEFFSSVSRIDWEVQSKNHINSRAKRLCNNLENSGRALLDYHHFVNVVYARYAALENYQKGIEKVGEVTVYSDEASITGSTTIPNDTKPCKKPEQWWEYLLDWGKDILKILDKYIEKLKDNKLLGGIASVLGLISTSAETIREGIDNVADIISTLGNLGADAFDLLSNLLKEEKTKSFGIISAVLSGIADFADLTTKENIAEVLKNAGDFIGDIGSGVTEVAKLMGKEVSDKVLAPVLAIGNMVTRGVGDFIDFSKDGWTVQEFADLLTNTGLAGATSLIKTFTCNLIDIDVDDAKNYISEAGNEYCNFIDNTNLPQWAKVTGKILGSPIVVTAGVGNMILDGAQNFWNMVTGQPAMA